MLPIEQNLSLLERMLEEFELFILSAEVFWPLAQGGIRGTPLPRLTIGGLLLILDELTALNPKMTPKQAMRHDRLLRKFEGMLEKWRVAIENKAIQELQARLNLWRAYLHDLEEQPEWIENYPREVRTRVMMEHLIAIIGPNPDLEVEFQAIKYLDDRIHNFLLPGEFIWEDPLQQLYPRDTFPFLYMRPRDSIIRSFSDR
ncbi:MAG: hypothetical protein A2Z14_13575 [Chloroflexi bacterium RBG_16_48_8]|nr:MAG: hypothetical protein A2Z14_13575 [Chloroflexi bacterium RBG_16_48_8]